MNLLIKRTYNSKCLCTYYQNIKTHKSKPDQTEKWQRIKCIIIDGDFNTHLSIVDITSRQKISKDIEKNTIRQLDLTDIQYSIQQQNPHPSQVHTEHLRETILWSQNKSQYISKDSNLRRLSCLVRTELESIRKISGKTPNTWKLNNIFLNNTWENGWGKMLWGTPETITTLLISYAPI